MTRLRCILPAVPMCIALPAYGGGGNKPSQSDAPKTPTLTQKVAQLETDGLLPKLDR